MFGAAIVNEDGWTINAGTPEAVTVNVADELVIDPETLVTITA